MAKLRKDPHTPTPCRSLFGILAQSRDESGIDKRRKEPSPLPSPSEMGSPNPAEADVPKASKVSRSPSIQDEGETLPGAKRKRGRPRKVPPESGKEEPRPARPARPARRPAAVVPVEEVLSALVSADEFRPQDEEGGRPKRARFPVLRAWCNERLVYERKPGSVVPTISGCKLVDDSK
ncbi:unnamed protein product, partial [Effrenium voratum]